MHATTATGLDSTGSTSATPIRAASARAMSIANPFGSPVFASLEYWDPGNTPIRILPARTMSATRGSGVCCASAMPTNIAVITTARSSFLMFPPGTWICAASKRAGALVAHDICGRSALFRVRLCLPATPVLPISEAKNSAHFRFISSSRTSSATCLYVQCTAFGNHGPAVRNR